MAGLAAGADERRKAPGVPDDLDALRARCDKGPLVATSRTVRVTLADAPTDVLVYLAGNPRSKFTSAWITGAVAPDDAENALETVALALRLLHDGGYVKRCLHTHWQVTEAGVTAVREAVRATVDRPGSEPHADPRATEMYLSTQPPQP